jgi:pectin lyase
MPNVLVVFWADLAPVYPFLTHILTLYSSNKYQNVATVIEAGATGKYFTVPGSGSVCSSFIGRSCQNNAFGSSGAFSSADTSFLGNFKGKNIASAAAASSVSTANVGYGKI